MPHFWLSLIRVFHCRYCLFCRYFHNKKVFIVVLSEQNFIRQNGHVYIPVNHHNPLEMLLLDQSYQFSNQLQPQYHLQGFHLEKKQLEKKIIGFLVKKVLNCWQMRKKLFLLRPVIVITSLDMKIVEEYLKEGWMYWPKSIRFLFSFSLKQALK